MCSMHQQNSSASTRDKDTHKKEKQRKQSKEEKESEWQKDDNIRSCDLVLETEAKGHMEGGLSSNDSRL